MLGLARRALHYIARSIMVGSSVIAGADDHRISLDGSTLWLLRVLSVLVHFSNRSENDQK
jgi:hypothetical protein